MTAWDFITGNVKQKESQQKVFNIITNEAFIDIEHLNKSLQILNWIDVSLFFFSTVLLLYLRFIIFAISLKRDFENMAWLSEKIYIYKQLNNRLDFIYEDAISFGYLLDPRFLGEAMSPDKNSDWRQVV